MAKRVNNILYSEYPIEPVPLCNICPIGTHYKSDGLLGWSLSCKLEKCPLIESYEKEIL